MRFPKPKKLDLYILQEVTFPFLGGVVFFSFVFLMFQALRLADFFIIHGVGGWMLLKMIALMILSFLLVALPVAFLIGVLVGFGRLSADSELVAIKAHGVSLLRMAVPVILLSVIAATISLGLNLEWVPWGDRTFKSTLIKVSNTKIAASIKEGAFTSGFFDMLIFADRVDPKTNRMQRVFIYDESEPKNPVAVVAREGQLVPVKTGSSLGAAMMLKLFNGNIHRNDIGGGTYTKIDFGEYKIFRKIDEGLDTSTMKPKMVPYDQLMSEIQRTKWAHPDYVTELFRRFAVAMSPIIFVFLGIGFGTVRTRSVRSGAALIALSVIVVYWAIQAVVILAAQKGQLPPWFAMQIPNLVMAGIAAKVFRSASW